MSAKPPVKINLSHEALADLIIARQANGEALHQGELAKEFGWSQAWLSTVMNTDLFKGYLAKRKAEISDPVFAASLGTKFEALGHAVTERLESRVKVMDDRNLLALAELTAKTSSLGGFNPGKSSAPTTNFAVILPAQASGVNDWLKDYAPQHLPPTLETVERVGE